MRTKIARRVCAGVSVYAIGDLAVLHLSPHLRTSKLTCISPFKESNRETSYKYYIAALKYAPGFAPAFSALGVYYVEAAEPHDPARAARCFQKAFELDAGQADAARRLASGFADEREWDLVEAVARRAIAGEGGLAGGLGLGEGDKEVTAAAARYKPTNAWAWKALGIVELVTLLSLMRVHF